MKQHFKKALALLLVTVMVLSVFPAVSFATEEGEKATLINGLPKDGDYGVIYYCGANPGALIGADAGDGSLPTKRATLSTDGKSIPSLPNGAAVFKFIKNDDGTYYLMLGSQYLAIVLVDGKSKIVLQESVEGALWDLAADGTGAYTLASHDLTSSYKYLEFYRDSITAYKMTEDKTLYQFKFFSCSPDEDGRVGEIREAGPLPENGQTCVIYNHEAKAVFGQPTGADIAAPALLCASAVLNEDQTIDYANVSDGGMIFTVETYDVGGTTQYAFENNGKYLAMSENFVNEQGKVDNDETISMIDLPEEEERVGYTRWTLTEVVGGYVMYNVAARYGTSKCCIEFFNEVFSGWSYKSATPELFAMNFIPMEDVDQCGFVSNPAVLIDEFTPSIGTDTTVSFTLDDASEVTEVCAEFVVSKDGEDGASKFPKIAMVGKKGSFTIPSADLLGWETLTLKISAADALGKSYEAEVTVEIRDMPLIVGSAPAANSATGDEKRPEISVSLANIGAWVEQEMPDTVDPVERFEDVNAGKYYTEAVNYVVEWGLMSGKSATVFGTKDPLTREMFVTILWALDGRPAPTIENPFEDVTGGYAYSAILWAFEKGITTGTSATTFNRKAAVKRQDLAVFLLKYAELRGMDTRQRADVDGYADANSISGYAKDAMQWAVAIGMITGTGDKLLPKNSATRAQVAVMLMAFDQLLGPRMTEDTTGVTFELLVDGEPVDAVLEDNVLRWTPGEDLEDGKHTVKVTVTRADGKSVTKEWFFYVGESGEALYYGQVHSHTSEYSDGVGTLEDAYEHAHGVDDLDFLFVTDHSNYFDTTATATTSSYYDLSSLLKNAAGDTTKWEEARATADYFNKLYDDFLCLYGYEMTWSGGPGHTNSFNTYGVISRNNASLNNKTGYAGMHLYNDMMVNAEKGLDIESKEAKTKRYAEYSVEMKGENLEVKPVGTAAEVTGVNATKYIPFDENGEAVPVVSQFNHPGKTFGNFDNYAGYSAKRDDVLNLIEVGNGEGKVGGSAYFPSYSEYDLCLSMGWHVAPTNNQDNHKGNWGNANTCRDVVLTDDFSEIGIYRALDARRVYSTEDQNLQIFYELIANGETYKLGDIAPIDESEQPETVTAKLNITDPDGENIATVEVIGEGGKTLVKQDVNADAFKDNIEIPNTEGYYYIRVVEADGDIAVTAPVWVREAIPVAADLETSASVAAQGEEETIIATLTNGSENVELTLTGYTVEAEGSVLVEETGLSEVVAPAGEKVLEIPFTPSIQDPPEKKTYEISVTFQVVYKDKALTYTKTITETSYHPSQMTYIGLDNGHKNFYVSGDYAGNDGNFLHICAERGIICQYIEEGQMTSENLAKYKAVFLTVPRINEQTQPPVWSAEELAALAEYAANGGTILNFCKSDRYDFDQDTFSSAALSNLVNEAVGAKTRFIRGIVVDNEMRANEAYRINFTGRDLVGEHPLTDGIYPSSNGTYQWYNGTGIAIEEGAEDVVALMKPYDSTWVACYKDNFTGSSYDPNYETDTVMAEKDSGFALVTVEPLSGGGFLYCAGATFISNYDLKYGIAFNEQYENYALVCNILDYIKDGEFDEEITPIAEVHNGEVGEEFTVEGWVTSNASDYDKDTAFFDCIYVQDETRGINCFPVSGYYFIGENVRIHGGVTYYCGEIELNLSTDYNGSIKVISNDLTEIQPTPVTCAEAMSDENIGNLMKITGVITEIHETAGIIDMIYVDDGSGETAMLFINGYIQKESTALDEAEVGMNIEGVGIGSRDVDEASGGVDGQIGDDIDPSLFIKRLRVRARDEILVWAAELDTTELEAAIAEAEALDRELYTASSLAAVDEALAAAQAVMEDPDKDQKAVTQALSALRAALDALEEKGESYVLTSEISDGDVVVIYNAGNKKAVKAEMSGYYMAGMDVTPEDGAINNPDPQICWTVTGNDDGTYTFRCGTNVLAVGKSGTYTNLYLTETDHSVKWTLASCNASNKSYTVYAPEMTANYAHVYLEWYGSRTAFSAYDTSEDRATEQNFGFQFYVKSEE